MSILIKELNENLNNDISIEKLLEYDSKLIEEYNTITQDYRRLFKIIDLKIKKKKQEIINNCQHNYIRYSEYHNERYFICDKCGNEKY